MNHAAIIRMLSFCGLIFSAAMLVCSGVAFLVSETAQFHVFLTTAVLLGTLAMSALVLAPTPKRRAQPSDGLAFMVLFWFVAGAACAPPFLMGVPNDSAIAALHEAISCLTTTGHSAFTRAELELPGSIIVWRAFLHLVGAIATITFAATVLAALNLDGPGIHRTHLFSLSDASFFDSIPRVLRTVSIAAAICVLLVFSIEVVGGIPAHTAFLDAVSAFSTGLADPVGVYQDVTRGARAIGLSIGLLLGSLGLFVLMLLVSSNARKSLSDPEVGTFFFFLALFSALAIMHGVNVVNAFGWAISSLSTSGIALVSPATTHSIPLALQLAPALVGGAALSSAGGIKLARLYVLSRRVGQEFLRVSYGQSLLSFEFRRRVQSDRTIMGIWVYLVAYVMATVVGLILFSFSGSSFEDAITNTIGSLTNSGHLIDLEGLPGNPLRQFWLILGMILGRLEVLAFVPLLTVSFWRR